MTAQRRKALFLAAATMLALAACSTVSSHYAGIGEGLAAGAGPGNFDASGNVSERADGLTYFLPRQLAKVTVKRNSKVLAETVQKLEKKLQDLREAEAGVDAAKATIAQTQASIIATPSDDDAKRILRERLEAQTTALNEAETKRDNAQKAYDDVKTSLSSTVATVNQARIDYFKLLSNAEEAKRAANKAENDRAALQSAAMELQESLATATDATRPDIQAKIAQNRHEMEVARLEEQRLRAAQHGAEKLVDEFVKADADKKSLEYNTIVEISLQAPSADPAQTFRLNPKHSWLRDDEHKISISPAGLLTNTDVSASDRTADVLVEIGTLAGALSSKGLAFFAGTDTKANEGVARCLASPDQYSGLVDLASPTDVDNLNKELNCLGTKIAVSGTHWAPSTRPTEASKGSVAGIVYRSPVDVFATIEKCMAPGSVCHGAENAWYKTEVIALSLPQAGPISYVKQPGGFGTKTTYVNTFKDGMLATYSGTRPSEALYVAATPMRIINGFFDGVSKVISLKTGQNTARAGLSASELAVLNGQINYQVGQINGQRSIDEAHKNAMDARFALQAAAISGPSTLTDAQITALQKQIALQAAQINGESTLADAQIALVGKQAGLQVAPINAQGVVVDAQAALLAKQIAQQTGILTGQADVDNARLAALTAQIGLITGGNALKTQLSSSELSLAVALLRDRGKLQLINDCLAKQPSSVDVCVP